MAKSSASDLKNLGITQKDLKLGAVRVLELTHACWRQYQCNTGKRAKQMKGTTLPDEAIVSPNCDTTVKNTN